MEEADDEYLSACEKAWKKHGNGEELHCCSRCHEDYGLGYDFLDIELSDGTMIECCCEVYNKLKALNKTKEDES